MHTFKSRFFILLIGVLMAVPPSLAQASFYLGLGYGEVDYDGINRPFNDLLGSTAHCSGQVKLATGL